jgi:hypothetical protein
MSAFNFINAVLILYRTFQIFERRNISERGVIFGRHSTVAEKSSPLG